MSRSTKVSLYHQPKGLYLLCATEMWERFGFYTVQAILILYLTKALGYSDQRANLTYATYSALLYLTPIIGGFVADRFLGFQKAVLIGGLLSALGYLVLVIPNEKIFFIGLSILISANGLFKPNVSAIVGDLYETNDPRRDGGFTLFYMGINVGALIPPVIAGVLVLHYGWHSGFLLAAAGMIVGQITFMVGRKRLALAGSIPSSSPLQKTKKDKIEFQTLFYLGFIIITALCILAFQYTQFTNIIIEISALILIAILLFFTLKEPVESRKKILASVLLIIISIGFWALYNQTFTSLTLFADRNMEHHFWGIPVNASTMQFFNPLYIILFSPILSTLWIKLSKKQLNPSIPMKFAFGVAFLSIGFLMLPLCIHFFQKQGVIASDWLVLSYLFQTIGELLLSPVGLSMITVLVPHHLVGMMMGVWFFAVAASFALGGSLANLAAVPDNLSQIQSMAIYNHAFFLFGILSAILTVISFVLLPILRRLVTVKVKE